MVTAASDLPSVMPACDTPATSAVTACASATAGAAPPPLASVTTTIVTNANAVTTIAVNGLEPSVRAAACALLRLPARALFTRELGQSY